MPEDDDPIAHGHEAAVQAVTVLATVAGEMARRSAVRVQSRSDELVRSDVRDRVQRGAGRARDAVRWSPMLDRDFRSVATAADALAAWSAAAGWVDRDPQAARASRLAETVLRRTDPAAMAVYDTERAEGVDHWTATCSAARHIADPRRSAAESHMGGLAAVLTAQADSADLAQVRPGHSRRGAARQSVDEGSADLRGASSSERSAITHRTKVADTTLDVRRPSGVSVDFPVVITTVPIRITPPGPGAAGPPTTPRPSIQGRQPGSAR